MFYTRNLPERKAMSLFRYMRLRGTRALTLNDPADGDGCALEPGERAVLQVTDLGSGLIRTGMHAAVGDKLVRRIAPIDVTLPAWPCKARAGSDAARAHAQGGVHLRGLRKHEREALAADPDLSPITRAALDEEMKARRGSRFWRIIVETTVRREGEARTTLWCVPPGSYRAVVNPRNQKYQRERRAGRVPNGWHRI